MTQDALELETRRRLYAHILAHPGRYLREIQRDLGMAMGSLEYHLDRLEKMALVTSLQDSNKRFFPAQMDRRDKPMLAVLRQELPRRILVTALGAEECTKSQLVHDLEVAPSTLNYHLRRLSDAGLLEASHVGREAVYRLRERDAVLRLLVAHRSSFMDRLVDHFLATADELR